MKTLILLISSGVNYLQYLPLNIVKENSTYRIILIANKKLQGKLPSHILAAIDDIAYVNTAPSDKIIKALSYEETCRIVYHIYQTSKDLVIYTLNESNILLAAQLRDAFNLEGLRYDQALSFRDKALMKQRLSEKNIKLPDSDTLDRQKIKENSIAYFHTLLKRFGLPFILKPTAMAGGVGIKKIECLTDFIEYTQHSQLQGTYHIESFIEGHLYHCDTLLHKGETIWSECSRYNAPLLNITKNQCVGSIPLESNDPLGERIRAFSKRVLRALNYETGISHLEVFHTKQNELIFLETTARAGGLLITPMYIHTFGFNLILTDLLLRLNINPSFAHPNITETLPCFWVAFPQRSGKVSVLNQPYLQSSFQIDWAVKPGDITRDSRDMLDISGTLFAKNKNYQTLLDDFKNIGSFIPYQIA